MPELPPQRRTCADAAGDLRASSAMGGQNCGGGGYEDDAAVVCRAAVWKVRQRSVFERGADRNHWSLGRRGSAGRRRTRRAGAAEVERRVEYSAAGCGGEDAQG